MKTNTKIKTKTNTKASGGAQPLKLWKCFECGRMNYPSRKTCPKCDTVRGDPGRIKHWMENDVEMSGPYLHEKGGDTVG